MNQKTATGKGTLQDSENHIREVESSIVKNAKDIETTEQRLAQVKGKAENTQQQYGKLRRERQVLLVDGKDPSTINNKLAEVKNHLEQSEDEQIGLENKLELLKDKEQELQQKLQSAKTAFVLFKLINLVPKYNDTALELAKIVSEILNLKDQLPGTVGVWTTEGWINNALENIPQLYLPGQETTSEHSFLWSGNLYLSEGQR